MSNSALLQNEELHTTRMGKAFLCERVVYRGKDLHCELGDKDWLSLYLYGITGRLFEGRELTMLNYFWVCTSYPDPSIWPNHVTELAGSVRSTASLSLMSGLSISEASIYGRRPDRRACDFFIRAGKLWAEGQTVEQIVKAEMAKYKTIYGYGRPLAKLDERVIHMVQKARDLGFDNGHHFRLALEIYRYLKAESGLTINVAALGAALAADMGFTPHEYHLYLTPVFVAGMVPCYLDALEKPEGAAFPMRCESIRYEGHAKRSW